MDDEKLFQLPLPDGHPLPGNPLRRIGSGLVSLVPPRHPVEDNMNRRIRPPMAAQHSSSGSVTPLVVALHQRHMLFPNRRAMQGGMPCCSKD